METKLKRGFVGSLLLVLAVAVIFSLNSVSSVGEISYCAERTVDGAWCQNVPEEKVDKDYRFTPSSCESTTYCSMGTCIDSQEGTCMENTPQRICEEEGGLWENEDAEEIPQCQLGCCLIGDEAAFVTQTRCKKLSADYGLETNYRADIGSESQCIATATSDVKGACVFEEEFERTCEMTTKRECQEMEASREGGVDFHEGMLCSSERLGTNCGPTEQTRCVEGEDEVYFVDSCGNLANIYDASQIDSQDYWSEMKEKGESCNPDSSNSDSSTCGNCDYYLGSTCKEFERGEDQRPTYGDNICRNLGCEYQGENYQHGETWCAGAEGIDESLPGSRASRLVCYNGEVTVEPCADFRNEVCVESEVNGFSAAACRVNRWQDCNSQDNQRDCENTDRRDCNWMGELEQCVPQDAPGFDFWNSDTDAQSICSRASEECVVKYEEDLLGNRECVENCECLTSSWVDEKALACTSIGDCGVSVNYKGIQGYDTEYDVEKDDVD